MKRRFRGLLIRLFAVLMGILIPLLFIETGLRLAYGSLSPGLRIALRFVRITPFSDQRLSPLPIWMMDNYYQTIVKSDVQDSLQVGSINLQFWVNTYSWWGGRVGFRTPQPETGRVEAVALGDSHTFCFVEDRDCWVNLLSAQTGLHVANFGQPVTGSLSHERLYYDFVAKPELKLGQPKLVLWQFYGNDYNDDYGMAVLESTNKTAPPPTDSSVLPQSGVEKWLNENSATYAVLRALSLAGTTNLFVDPYRVQTDTLDIEFGRPYILQAFDMTQARNQEGEMLTHQAILRTRALVEQNGGKFVILIMPTKEEVYRTMTAPFLGEAALEALGVSRQRLNTFCQAQNLTCLDLTPALMEQAARGVQLFHRDDIHLNTEGNRVFADAVGRFLHARKMLP